MSSAASGKALSNNSKVYTKNGFKMIKDVVVGDVIFGEDGLLHKVIGVFPQGKKRGYKVTFSDGTEVICCKEHLWTFQTESLRSKKSKTFFVLWPNLSYDTSVRYVSTDLYSTKL